LIIYFCGDERLRIGLVTRSQTDYAIDLANEFNAEGASVALYINYSETEEEAGNSAEPVERLYETGLLPRSCQVQLLRLPRMRDPRSLWFFFKLARRIRADGIEVLHILLNPGEIWFAVLACLLFDVPVVTTIIVPVANTGERLPPLVFWVTNKLACLGSDMVIVNGSDQVTVVERRYGVPADRIAYIPLSLDARADKLVNEDTLEEPDTVLFFGRAHPQKGLEYFVKAQPYITLQAPRARFLVSAHGEDLQRCRLMIQDASRFEISEGVVSGEMLAKLFQRAALVVLPYLSASTSGVLVTAYSFGKPVVASRVGCLAEYVEDEVTGLLVTPAEVNELASAVSRLLLDDSLRHRMGRNAKNWMKARQKDSIRQTMQVYMKANNLHFNAKAA
jgi:glycosyltransferase involved in cell wall biosynthesis